MTPTGAWAVLWPRPMPGAQAQTAPTPTPGSGLLPRSLPGTWPASHTGTHSSAFL